MSKPDLLPTVETETTSAPDHAVIWMHGLGADGNDFVPIINEFKLSTQIGIRFVFPHAPMKPVTINNGYVMRAWYDITGAKFDSAEDETGIRETHQAIDALIDNELQRGIAANKIVLAGFSQGGAIALHTGLRQKNKLAGILALSCYLPLADTMPAESQSVNATIPIFMAHGLHDAVVPMSLAATSRDKLRHANYSLEWHEYPMDHTVCLQEIQDMDNWLHNIFLPSADNAE